MNIYGLDPANPTNKYSEFVRGIIQRTPFADNAFDTVVSLNLFNEEYYDVFSFRGDGTQTMID